MASGQGIGEAVKAWAKQERVQLREIAAALGVSYTQLSRNLSGAQPMTAAREAQLRAMMAGSGVPDPAPLVARGRGYADAPDRLAVAVGALWVIRDAADAALRRVEASTPARTAIPNEAAGVDALHQVRRQAKQSARPKSVGSATRRK